MDSVDLLLNQATAVGHCISTTVHMNPPHSHLVSISDDPGLEDPNQHTLALRRPQGDEDESDAEVNQKRLRMYERSKLRYYFAVVECDAVSTASNLYAQCDGLEFELTANRYNPAAFLHSCPAVSLQCPLQFCNMIGIQHLSTAFDAVLQLGLHCLPHLSQTSQEADQLPDLVRVPRLDLRFVPEEQGFADRQARDSASSAPPDYEPPPFFTTAALQHSNVKLTWDATPDDRRRALSKRVKAEELRDDDFKVTCNLLG